MIGGAVRSEPPAPPLEMSARFEQRMAELAEAASEFGVRWKEPEGRFMAALLGGMQALTEVVASAQESFASTAAQARGLAEAELRKVREVAVAIDGARMQARAVIEVSKAEQERVLKEMVASYLPQFLEGIRDVTVVRERSWNRRRARNGYGVAGLVVLTVFLSGFGLCLWIQWAEADLGSRCLHALVRSGGHTYCLIDDGEPRNDEPTDGKR